MSETGKGGGLQFWQILPAFLLFPLFLVIFIVVGIFSNNGPNAQGATLPQSIQVSNPQVSKLIQQLQDYTDPSKFLTANSAQISDLRTQLVAIQNGINQNQPAFSNLPNKTQVAALCQKMISELDQISSNLGSTNHTQAIAAANSFIADIKQLDTLAPSGVACAGGGTCLDVPVITQGHSGYCGGTAVIMAALYYTGGKIPAGDTVLGHALNTQTTPWTSTVGSVFVSPDNIQKYAVLTNPQKNDWIKVTSVGTADDMYNEIKASINGGDPVIMYTAPGAFYPNSQHIVTVVGYNDANQTIYVNNPKEAYQIGGTTKATNVGLNGQLLTKDFIYAHNGSSVAINSHHIFIIRKAYCQKCTQG